MVDTTGNGAGSGVQAFVERTVEGIWLKFLARVLMIVGGFVSVPALALLGMLVSLIFDMRDDWRDWKRDVPEHTKEIRALKEADQGFAELRGAVGRQATAIERLEQEDRRTASQLEGVNTRLQSLEFQNRGR